MRGFLTLDDLARQMRPIFVRLMNLVARGEVKRVDDSTKVQQVQAQFDDEVRDELEHFQGYGFTSVPDADAECVVLFVGGKRDNGYVVGVDDRRYRPTGLAAGTVCIYSKSGSRVTLFPDGNIELKPTTDAKVKVVGSLEVSGSITAGGDVSATGVGTAGAISLTTHVHGNGNNGSPTDGPESPA